MKKTDAYKKEKAAREDVVINRLLLIFFSALALILVFSWLNKGARLLTFINIQPWLKWIFVGLTLAAAAFWLYKKKSGVDESVKAITSAGLFWSALTVAFIVFLYPLMKDLTVKTTVIVAIVALLAFIYELFKKTFFIYSVFSFAVAAAVYYRCTDGSDWALFSFMSKIGSICVLFAVPVIIAIAFCILAVSGYKLTHKDKTIFKTSKTAMLLLLIVAVFSLALAVLALVFPASLIYMLIPFTVAYIGVGVFCTINAI